MALKVILLAIAVRVLIALATQTYFQPDEYYQSLEVAHHLVYGYGHLTWEWLTPKPIRSIFYPLLNVPIYAALKLLGLDDTRFLVCTCPGLAFKHKMTNLRINRYGGLRYCMGS